MTLLSKAADSEARTNNLNLLRAIDAVVKSDSPQNRRALYEAALKAWFLVPTRRKLPGPAGKHILDADTVVSFPMITDAHGNKVVPCFTDEQALAHWAGPSPWCALQGSTFFQAVIKTEAQQIAINPFTTDKRPIRPTVQFSRAEFEPLAAGLNPYLESLSS